MANVEPVLVISAVEIEGSDTGNLRKKGLQKDRVHQGKGGMATGWEGVTAGANAWIITFLTQESERTGRGARL